MRWCWGRGPAQGAVGHAEGERGLLGGWLRCAARGRLGRRLALVDRAIVRKGLVRELRSGFLCRASMTWRRRGAVWPLAPFGRPWSHLHDNAVAVEVGGGLGNLGGSGGRHVDLVLGLGEVQSWMCVLNGLLTTEDACV